MNQDDISALLALAASWRDAAEASTNEDFARGLRAAADELEDFTGGGSVSGTPPTGNR